MYAKFSLQGQPCFLTSYFCMMITHQNSTGIYNFPATAHPPELYTQKVPGVYKYMPHNVDVSALLSAV
jgi:hypothetical protein